MSHRREAGAVPPWVLPEEHARCSVKSGINQSTKLNTSNIDNEIKGVDNLTPKNDQMNKVSSESNETSILKPKKKQLYITGGQLVNNDYIQHTDLLIEDGKVIQTGIKLEEVQSDIPTLNANGMLIMPAGIDMSTCLIQNMNSIDKEAYIEATKKALLGGTTTIVDTIICPKDSSAIDLLLKYQDTFKETKFWCDIIIRIGFVEIQENQINEIDQLTKQYGINSFLFIIDPIEMDKTSSKDSQYIMNLLKAFNKCKQTGSIAFIKCDLTKTKITNNSMNPLNKQNDLELRSIEKCLFLANSTNCPVIVTSINNVNTIEKISKAKRQIPPIHIDVCCTSSKLLPNTKNNQQTDSEFLHLLTNGDIKFISSDPLNIVDTNENLTNNHLQTIQQRLITIWENGVPSGWLDATTFVNLTSTNASRYSGLYPNKGCLQPGSDADLILWPNENPIHSTTIQCPILVIHRGKLIAYNGHLIEKKQNDDNNNNNNFKGILLNNNSNEIHTNEPCGRIQKGKLFPSPIYNLVNASERLRKRNQMPVIREPWTLNDFTEEINTISKLPNHNSEQTNIENSQNLSSHTSSSIHMRTIRGNRDLHASGFSLSGAQVDDDQPLRTGIRTQQLQQNETRNPLW
ncbi:unnamed protein product [Schistosoma turkestanicum]|nr:unnamed protein product [Schistosoma turkestanicum]